MLAIKRVDISTEHFRAGDLTRRAPKHARKAVAKFVQSYHRLDGGFESVAMEMFTGKPALCRLPGLMCLDQGVGWFARVRELRSLGLSPVFKGLRVEVKGFGAWPRLGYPTFCF